MKARTKCFIFLCVLVVLSSFPSPGATFAGATYIVDRLTDPNPTGGGEGAGLAGDLRYAITNAQSGDSITFNVTGTINLVGALPSLTQDVSIEGPGANSLTVHRGGFAVNSGTTVVLSGLTITGGVGNGGGIFNAGTLTLNNVTVSGNVAGDPTNGEGTGAGIWNYLNATLTLNSSTVSGNSAIGSLFYSSSRGGGIANYGTLTLNNSTVSGNSAPQGSGGGISNTLGISTLTLNNSTVSGNSATGTGGISNRGTFTARNTIIAGNTGGDLFGVLTTQGHNLLGTGGRGFDATDLVNVDPMLGPLQDNGGTTATMAPWPDSPAVNYIPGTPDVDFPTTDQRGVPRPQGTLADIGAVEVVLGCGNGVVEGTEQCDLGANNGQPGFCCSATCQFVSVSTVCRASAGVCDVAETCTGASDTCPVDAKSTAVCRPSVGACDIAESCDGVHNTCPANTYKPSSTVCRPAAGACDVAESCTGTSAYCPANTFKASSAVCRPSFGACDVAETCTGTSPFCPTNTFKASSTVCRPPTGACDVAASCTGTSAFCPANTYKGSSVVCRPAYGACDVAESCSGTSAYCPANTYKASGTVCRPAAGVCDVAETCTGTSPYCPANTYKGSSVVCRPAAGACDVAESCSGTSARCPADHFQPDHTTCDDGNPTTCNDQCSAGSCTGMSC